MTFHSEISVLSSASTIRNILVDSSYVQVPALPSAAPSPSQRNNPFSPDNLPPFSKIRILSFWQSSKKCSKSGSGLPSPSKSTAGSIIKEERIRRLPTKAGLPSPGNTSLFCSLQPDKVNTEMATMAKRKAFIFFMACFVFCWF